METAKTGPQGPILEVQDLRKVYGARGTVTRALDQVSFTVEPGEFVGIMGASGSGKTTLLNCISTIDTPTAGRVLVAGQDITALRGRQLAAFRRERLGFIFQDFNLLDTLTARDNIALALSVCGTPPARIEPRLARVAAALDIAETLDRYPYELSGGQQQRVAAARALVTDPALVLADEPTGSLDSHAARMLLRLLGEMNDRFAATILMVTHDPVSASYCRRILFIRDGRLFSELRRGDADRRTFFEQIMDVVAALGGDPDDLL